VSCVLAEGKVDFQNTSIFDEAGSQKEGKSDLQESAGISPLCPQCGSKKLYRDGLRYLADGSSVQRWLCRNCAYRFSEKPTQKKPKWPINTPNTLTSRRRICANRKEAKNLTTATETKTVAGDLETRGLLLQFAFYLNKEGKSQGTITTYTNYLKRLARHADLDDPESVKEHLARIKKSVNTKASYCVAYTAFLSWQGKTWKPPKYSARSPIPEFIPTEEEIDQLIAGCGKKTAAILQTLKETGMRIGECLSLKWTALNEAASILTLNNPEKNSLPRIFNISPKLALILRSLPKTNEKIFGLTKPKHAQSNFSKARQKIARKVGNPRLAKIHFHLIRHWFGTMEYHKKPDPDYVRRRLGHKSLQSTQIYINIEQALFSNSSNEYHVKIAQLVEQAMALIEVGFEYVTGEYNDGGKIFRKRK
jgi:integrase